MKNITKQEFIKAVRDVILLKTSRTVKTESFSKLSNNGKKTETLMVHYPGRIGISVDMEGFYEYFCEQDGDIGIINNCAGMILEMLDQNMRRAGGIQKRVQGITDYKNAKPMLRIRLVNGRPNKEKLSTAPHIPCLDLEIVFYLEVANDGDTAGSIAVNEYLFGKWGVSLKQMYQDAMENMQREVPPTIRPIEEILMEILELPGIPELPEIPDTPIFILSNNYGMYGAASILYPGILEKCAETIGGDFCIIPSSVHEVLLWPMAAAGDADALGRMIREINAKEVPEEDVLSDHPYYYSVKEKKVTM